MPQMLLSEETAFVTGWGRCDLMGRELCLPRLSAYFPDEIADPMLRSVSFTINSPNFYCEGYKQHEIKINSGMLCTGQAREELPTSPCLAVPGAPLVVRAKLAGILSWGFGCNYLHDLPLVYTSVQYYTMWIAQNVIVFRKISANDLTPLFQATKSVIILDWLSKTRVSNTSFHKHGTSFKELRQWEVDQELTKLQGDPYDIRDFIFDEDVKSQKQLLYKVIRNEQRKNKTQNKGRISLLKQKLKINPFFSNKSLLDISINYEDNGSSDED